MLLGFRLNWPYGRVGVRTARFRMVRGDFAFGGTVQSWLQTRYDSKAYDLCCDSRSGFYETIDMRCDCRRLCRDAGE